MKLLWRWAKSAFFALPLLGGMRKAQSRELLQSAAELACVLIFSLLPLWLALLVSLVFSKQSIYPSFLQYVDSGFLLIYSASIIGPSLYWVLKDYGPVESNPPSKMPHQISMVLVITLTCIISSALYAMIVMNTDGIGHRIENQGLFRGLSYLFFGLSVISLFVMQTYKNILEHSPQERRERGDTDTMANWRGNADGAA
jgi:uncharacterized Tic20 family protein